MEERDAVERLSALAQESRLKVFRLLVRAGLEGLAAGAIGKKLGIPSTTLSFHLGHLTRAGLCETRRAGTSIIYALRVDGIRELLGYLMTDCCQGRPELCHPAQPVAFRTRLSRKPVKEPL